jgi:hypothetical protein
MMRNVKLVGTLLILLIISSICLGKGKKGNIDYRIYTKIEPVNNMIECSVEIENPADSSFFLNKDMNISRLEADGIEAKYILKESDESLFMPNSRRVILQSGIPKKLFIKYSGKFVNGNYPQMISNVNMILPDIVELALYLTWYPIFKNSGINFELSTDLPDNFSVVTNGRFDEEKKENGRSITKWKSFSSGMDIVILAAPNMKKSVLINDGVIIEIYYDKISDGYIDSMKTDLLNSVNGLTRLLGKSKKENLVRVAYSPRKYWGYVRTPFIIVSEGNALYWNKEKFKSARDFRYLTHEIAHYWWGSAEVNTPEDWINEGLAEYSAFIISEKYRGKEFCDQLLKEYTERAGKSKTETPIALTEEKSQDREVNRYDKPTILFNELRNKYGEETINRFLKSLYETFSDKQKATTEMFLEVMEKEIGKEAKDYFSDALYSKVWKYK